MKYLFRHTIYLIINNRLMHVIKPTIRQAPLQGDKESTLKNRRRCFEINFEQFYQLDLVLFFTETKGSLK